MRNVEPWRRFPQRSYGPRAVGPDHRSPPQVSRRANASNRLANGQLSAAADRSIRSGPTRRSNRFGPDECNCVANSHEILHGVVGNLGIEFLFKRYRDLENI
jgi:hypothetical protein